MHPVLIVVVTLESPAWNANTSPLNEFPANACPAHVKTLHALGRVAVTLKDQEHAGVQPAFVTWDARNADRTNRDRDRRAGAIHRRGGARNRASALGEGGGDRTAGGEG